MNSIPILRDGQVLDLAALQAEAWANKLRHGFNTTDVPLEIAYTHAEVTEAFDKWRRGEPAGDEIADIIIFGASLATMLGIDLTEAVAAKLAENASRTYTRRDNGTHQRTL